MTLAIIDFRCPTCHHQLRALVKTVRTGVDEEGERFTERELVGKVRSGRCKCQYDDRTFLIAALDAETEEALEPRRARRARPNGRAPKGD